MVDSASAARRERAREVRILDDDPQVLACLAHLVRSLHYEVRAFEDPAAFLSDAEEVSPACLIVDWQLPGHDGLDIIAQCQKQWPDAPAILVSGHVTVPATVAAMRQGVAGVLQKPIRAEELAREIGAALVRSRSRTTAAEERVLARRHVQELNELELSILKLLVEGTPNKNIATQTNLAIRTVEKYRRIVFDKLGVDSAAEATRIWVLATLEE
jgi:two-component system, LuxR family, response regulator FixJ